MTEDEREKHVAVFQAMTPEQRAAVDWFEKRNVTYRLAQQRREICREVEQDVYTFLDSLIWNNLQHKVDGWDIRRKHSTCNQAADMVRKTILKDRWLDVSVLDGRTNE